VRKYQRVFETKLKLLGKVLGSVSLSIWRRIGEKAMNFLLCSKLFQVSFQGFLPPLSHRMGREFARPGW
jgi:hypothetical protein